MKHNQFIIITPLKDEEKTIGKVIDSMLEQTLKPKLWIIVNDGSTDKSRFIIEDKIKGLNWILLINKTINKEYNWLGIVKVLNEGYNYVREKKIRYNFIGVLDSDITLQKDYYKELINKFNLNPKLGLAGGDLLTLDHKYKWNVEINSKSPRGGNRLYSKVAFVKSNYFPNTPSWDRISEIKIRNRGFEIMRFTEILSYQHRDSFGKVTKLKGQFMHGRGRYILNFNFLHMILICIKLSYSKKPYILSALYLWLGYLTGFFSKDERINDKEIINYSRNFWRRIK